MYDWALALLAGTVVRWLLDENNWEHTLFVKLSCLASVYGLQSEVELLQSKGLYVDNASDDLVGSAKIITQGRGNDSVVSRLLNNDPTGDNKWKDELFVNLLVLASA